MVAFFGACSALAWFCSIADADGYRYARAFGSDGADRVIMRALEKELREDVEKVRQRVDESLERSGRQLGERFKELVETNERRLEESSDRRRVHARG